MPTMITQDEFLEMVEEEYPYAYRNISDKEKLYDLMRDKPMFQNYAVPDYVPIIEEEKEIYTMPEAVAFEAPDEGYLGIGGDWLPDVMKAGYNESNTGIIQHAMTGNMPFSEKSLFIDPETGMEGDPNFIESIAVTIASMMMTPDLLAMWAGGKTFTTVTKALLTKKVRKDVAKKLQATGLSKASSRQKANSAVNKVIESNGNFTDILKGHGISEVMNPNKAKFWEKSLRVTESASGFGTYSAMRETAMQAKEIETKVNRDGSTDDPRKEYDVSKISEEGLTGFIQGAGIGLVHQAGTHVRRNLDGVVKNAVYGAEVGVESLILHTPPILRGEAITGEQWAHTIGTIFSIRGMSNGLRRLAKNKAKRDTESEVEADSRSREISALNQVVKELPEKSPSREAALNEIIELNKQQANSVAYRHLSQMSKKMMDDILDGNFEKLLRTKDVKGNTKYSTADGSIFIQEVSRELARLEKKKAEGKKLTEEEAFDLKNYGEVENRIKQELGNEAWDALSTSTGDPNAKITALDEKPQLHDMQLRDLLIEAERVFGGKEFEKITKRENAEKGHWTRESLATRIATEQARIAGEKARRAQVSVEGLNVQSTSKFKESFKGTDKPEGDVKTWIESDRKLTLHKKAFTGQNKSKFGISVDYLRDFVQNIMPYRRGRAGGLKGKRAETMVNEAIEFANYLANAGKSLKDVTRKDIEIFLGQRSGKETYAHMINALNASGYLSQSVKRLEPKVITEYARKLEYHQQGLKSSFLSRNKKEPTLDIIQSKTGFLKQTPITTTLHKILKKIDEINNVKGLNKITDKSGNYTFDFIFRDTNGLPLQRRHFKKLFETYFPNHTPKQFRQSISTWVGGYSREINKPELVELFNKIGLGHVTGRKDAIAMEGSYFKLSQVDRVLIKDAVNTYVNRVFGAKNLKDYEIAKGEKYISVKELREAFSKISKIKNNSVNPLYTTIKNNPKLLNNLGIVEYDLRVKGETVKALMRTALESGGRIVESVPESADLRRFGFRPEEILPKSYKYKLAEGREVPASKDIMKKATDLVAEKYPEVILRFEKNLGVKNGKEVLGRYFKNLIEIKEGRAPEDAIPHELFHHLFKTLEAIGDTKSKKLLNEAERLFKDKEGRFSEEIGADIVGKYVTGRLKDVGLIAKVKSWIKRFNANFKSFFGELFVIPLSKQDITVLFGEKILKGKLPKVEIKMKAPEYKLGTRELTKKEFLGIASTLDKAFKRTPTEKESFIKTVEKAKALEAFTFLSKNEIKTLRDGYGMYSRATGESGIQHAPNTFKINQYISALGSFADHKADANRSMLLPHFAKFEATDLSTAAEFNTTWMPFHKVMERYGGRIGKVLSGKVINHEVKRQLYHGKASIAIERITRLIKDDDIQYLIMRDEHLAQYLTKDVKAQAFAKKMNTFGEKEYLAKQELDAYFDFIWSEGSRIAENNMSPSEFLDFKIKWNKKYVHDYFTRSLTEEAIQYLKKQKKRSDQNEYQDLIDQIQESRKKSSTRSIRSKIEELEKSPSPENATRIIKLRRDIAKKENEIQKSRNEAERYLNARLNNDMKTVFSRYFEFERDVPLKLHLDNGKIQTYSTDFKDIFNRYARSQSRFLATADEFPELTKLSGKYTYGKSKEVRAWVGSETINKTSLSGYIRQGLQNQLFGDFDPAHPKLAKMLKSGVGVFGAMGLSSPMSTIKNIILGDIHTFTTFGGRALLDSWVKMANRDNWKRSLEQGSLDAGTQYLAESGLFNQKVSKNILKFTGFTISEKANRVRARLAGRFYFENAVKVLRGESQKFVKPSKKSILSKFKNTFKFTSEEIAFLERFGTERHNIPKDAAGYAELVRRQNLINDKADVMSHISTQGMTTTPFMPLFASKAMAKPLLLFYRMAYTATSNVMDNAIKPLQAGNALPLMRYFVGLGIGGELLWAMYEGVLGIERPSEDLIEHAAEDAIRTEIFGVATNVVSSYSTEPGIGGIIDSYTPFIFRSLLTLANSLTHVASSKPFKYDAIDKALDDILIGYKHTKQALNKRSNSYTTNRKNAKTHEVAFLKKIGKKEWLTSSTLDEKQWFYSSMKKKFELAETTADYTKAAETAWASYQYVYDHIIKEAIGHADGLNKMQQEKEASKKAKQIITNIIKGWKPFIWSEKSPEGRQGWANFLSNKTPEQKLRFEKIKNQYNGKYLRMMDEFLKLEPKRRHRYVRPRIDFNAKQF